MQTFRMPIGDWSDDGHGECDYYTVSTAKDLEDVRKAHFEIVEKTGVRLENICREYGDGSITDPAIIESIKKTGFNIYDMCDSVEEEGTVFNPNSIGMAKLWIYLLNLVDPSLELELKGPDLKMLPFYGYKDGKHIGYVGYGLF